MNFRLLTAGLPIRSGQVPVSATCAGLPTPSGLVPASATKHTRPRWLAALFNSPTFDFQLFSLASELSRHAYPKMQSGRSEDVCAHHRSHAGGSVTAPGACLPPWQEVFRAGLGSEPYCESGTKWQSRRPNGSQGSPRQISRRLVSGEKSGDHFLRKSLFSFSSMSRAVTGQA